MKKIEIRGAIVSSDYDCGWTEGMIQRGVLTPENRVRAALSEVKPDDDLEIHISSQGGDVFAGADMLNAIKATKFKSAKVILGALVASMAANIAANLATDPRFTIAAHSNTKIMYHGAWSCNWGGKQSMEDAAKLLGQINQDVKSDLLKLGAKAENINEWFAEGRMGWLTASEAKAMGLVKEIIGGEAPKMTITKSELSALVTGGMKVAAEDMSGVQVEDDKKDDQPPPPPPADNAEAIAELNKQIAEKNAKIAELELALTEKDASARAFQSELDKAKAKAEKEAKNTADILASKEKEISTLRENVNKFKAGFKVGSNGQPSEQPMDFKALIAKHGSLAAAEKAEPETYKKLMAKRN